MVKLTKCANPVKFLSINKKTIPELKGFNNTLDECNNGLEEYMAEKRREFPRFYFLSNGELIDILANSQRIEIIQLHLKTLFDNLVGIDVEGDSIKAIKSGEKEYTKLKQEMKISGPIEQWLKKLQEQMISSLSAYMKQAYNEYPSVDRKAFVCGAGGA